MCIYLSQQNSAEKNFELLAKSALPVTEEYANALKKRDDEHLVLKDIALKVAIVGLVALGVATAVTFSIAGGIVLAGLSLVPIQLSTIVDKQNSSIDTVVHQCSGRIQEIARDVSDFILAKRKEKIDAIFQNTHLLSAPTRTELKDTSNQFAALWDKEELDASYKQAMKNHTRLRLLAEVIIARTFDANSPMQQVQENCRRFLYGQNESYLILQWDIRGSCWKALNE